MSRGNDRALVWSMLVHTQQRAPGATGCQDRSHTRIRSAIAAGAIVARAGAGAAHPKSSPMISSPIAKAVEAPVPEVTSATRTLLSGATTSIRRSGALA